MKRQLPLFKVTLWCLLSLWIVFGSFELAEAVDLIQETVTEDGNHQDLDEEALVQLASSIKSEVPSLDTSRFTRITTATVTPTSCLSIKTVYLFTFLATHGPPPLPLYQQFSVYRI